MNPGKYLARIIDYGITATKNGDPQIQIKFEFQNPEKAVMNWFGTLKEGKGRDITIKSLIACGIKSDDIAALADGPASQMLNMEKDLNLTVDYQTDDSGKVVEKNGKKSLKIQWVNSVYRIDSLSRSSVAASLGDIRGDFHRIAAEQNYSPGPKNHAPKSSQPEPDYDSSFEDMDWGRQ